MPTLSLFSLAYLLSLLLFHSQTDLPAIWHTLNQVGGGPTVPLIACWALALTLLAKQGGMCHSRTQLAFFLLTAFACAQTTAGIQAAAHQQQQVPLSCNKQIIESKFRLVEKTFRDKGAQTWLIEHTPFDVQKTSKCLKPDARLQLFVESADLYRNITPSQQFRAALRIKPPKGTLQLEGFDVHRHWFANRIAGTAQLKSGIQFIPTPASWNPVVWMEQLRLHIANWIVDTLQGHPEQALVLAIVVGDQGLISPEDRDMFNTTGIAHLVAISGLHITLFAMLAGKLASNLWRRSNRLCLRVPAPLAGSLFGLLFAILYGLVAGWGVPAQRTVFMLFALCVGHLRGGLQSSWDTFFLALFLTLAFDSWALLDAGFMLSFGAVATLIFVTQGHVCFIKPQHEFVANAIKAQYAVTVGLILPCAMLFNQQSLISPVANALSIPWMSFVSTPLALLGGLLQHKWAIQLAADSLQVQREWLGVLNELSWAALPVHNQPLWINALVALGCLVLLLPPGLVSRWIGLALVAMLAWPAPRPAENDFWMTLMDVGQGTAIAIQTHRHLLIYDAGPAFNDRSNSARRVLLPWLAAHGYKKPDVFMLSHDDADHSGGAPLMLLKAPPVTFVSSIASTHPLNQEAKRQKSVVDNCHQMSAWTWDGVHFDPIPINADKHAPSKLLAKNNQSCVLRISTARHSVLLTGDIEAISEMQLLTTHGAHRLQSRVLVAPHHGSKTSSTEPFLKAVQPEIALIQAGWQNQFGHPHPQVITRLKFMGTDVYNTAQNGAMKWYFQYKEATPSVTLPAKTRRRYWHMHENSAKAP
ncbi:MAG: DNA internalization-related competence protein ComEC/Rec2 [Limnobacter sp.]|uniref:DNA internalization-related competence protein ComEC/Rec2 n=1 Tax=Limnobacter sp. TaxID=2003368 RepID=UPI0022CA1CBB|nr:DNA internalization-related competence protein ComEC/Rec2 [Limnobacter sp.]MCZ8015868.1 DNA internalization-related competence protein ComEC/Rec2 [Limnobacter sp.]